MEPAASARSPNRKPRYRRLRARHRPRFDAVMPVRTYREHFLACQLAADCAGVTLAAWIRRTLAAEAGRELRRRGYLVPRRVLDLAAAGRLAELEQLAASLKAGEASTPE